MSLGNSDNLTSVGSFLNGGLCTASALAITHPATTLKTLSQSKQRLLPTRNKGSVFPNFKYLWAGLMPNAISGALAESIAFMVHNAGKKHLQNEEGQLTPVRNLLVTSLAGFLGSPLNASLEQLMVRRQLYGGTLKFHFKTIYRTAGFARGVFKGTSLTSARDIGFNFGIFVYYDIVKKILAPFVKDPLSHDFLSGLVAGGFAGIITNPFDRLKTIVQGDVENKYSTGRVAFKKIILDEGFMGLFQGATARMVSIGCLVCATVMLKQRIPLLFPDAFKEDSTQNNSICKM